MTKKMVTKILLENIIQYECRKNLMFKRKEKIKFTLKKKCWPATTFLYLFLICYKFLWSVDFDLEIMLSNMLFLFYTNTKTALYAIYNNFLFVFKLIFYIKVKEKNNLKREISLCDIS